jgi:hypothetical protein
MKKIVISAICIGALVLLLAAGYGEWYGQQHPQVVATMLRSGHGVSYVSLFMEAIK